MEEKKYLSYLLVILLSKEAIQKNKKAYQEDIQHFFRFKDFR